MSVLTSPLSAGIAAYVLNLLLHLTVISLGVLAASHGLFRRDPAARHLLCLIGLIGLLLTPLAVGLEARAGYGLIKLSLPGAESAKAAEAVAPAPDTLLAYADKPYRVSIRPVVEEQAAPAWPMVSLMAIYLLGVSWGLLRFAHGCRKACRLQRQVSPWKEPTADTTLRSVEQTLCAPLPPVFTSPCVSSPVAVGLLRPAVILPEGLAEMLSPRQLRHVLLHECAHITLRHSLGGLLERIAGVLFWPHPLVRLVCRELARAREEMCDNVASQEDGAACYARTLLMIAQGIERAPNLASTLALLGAGVSLEARIAGLLDPRRNRMVSVRRWKLWAVTGTAVCVMASTAAIRVVAAQDAGPGDVQAANGIVTRIFPLQYVEANQAADYLRSALAPPQLAQISLSVDSRTNSLLVQGAGVQVAGISALLGRIESQAAQEYDKLNTPPTPAAPTTNAPVPSVQAARPIVSSTTLATQTYSVPLSNPALSVPNAASKSTLQSIKQRAATASKSTLAAAKAAQRNALKQNGRQQYTISVAPSLQLRKATKYTLTEAPLKLTTRKVASVTLDPKANVEFMTTLDKSVVYRVTTDQVISKPMTFKVNLRKSAPSTNPKPDIQIKQLKDEELLLVQARIVEDKAAQAATDQTVQDLAQKAAVTRQEEEKLRYDITVQSYNANKSAPVKQADNDKEKLSRAKQDLEVVYQKLDLQRKVEDQQLEAKRRLDTPK